MTGKKGMKPGSGGAREGAGRPTLGEEFKRIFKAIGTADFLNKEDEFQSGLRDMEKLQKRIETRLEKAQSIIDELEPLVRSQDYYKMSHWVKEHKNG
jgi:hypothetical protein